MSFQQVVCQIIFLRKATSQLKDDTIIDKNITKGEYSKMSNLKAVTNEDFEQSVIQADSPVLVDFYADWCGPCKTQTPILGELAQEFDGRVKFAKVDIDVEGNKDLAVKYDVMSVPTLIIFNNGEVKETMVGVTSKSKLQQKLEQLL
jgi:thioredoxin 1